ncbi:MAG TPA: hypothetical protein V6D25_08340 [Leptolyngbyaceae cyanobacterium]
MQEIPVGGLSSKIIHVFDREGDIAEVFAQISQTKNAGVLVRAAHNRSLEGENDHLWSYVTSTDVQFVKDVKLAETKKRNARIATLSRPPNVQVKNDVFLHWLWWLRSLAL